MGSLKLLLKYFSLQVNQCITDEMNSFSSLFTFSTAYTHAHMFAYTHTEIWPERDDPDF